MQSTYTEISSSSNQRLNGNGLLGSPRSPTCHWKSVFRLPNSSSKKLNTHNTSLALDTQFDSTTEGIASNTRSLAPPLTPNSYVSDHRSSCNSSYSQSTDSNSATTSRTPYSSTSQNNSSPPLPSYQPSIKEVPPPFDSAPTKKRHTKPEKPRSASSRSHGQVPRPRVQTSNMSSPFGISKPPSRSKLNTPLSPKSMGASASRFIRRVASAPNAKGLFTLGSRSGSSTKNGMLAPEDAPPLPPLVYKNGADSLETSSSSSSGGRLRPPPSAPVTPIKGRAREPPAFRRTYSSNSIKVRQVSACE
jgi:protein-serine/threonine kinase